MRTTAWWLVAMIVTTPLAANGQDDDRRVIRQLKEVEWPRSYREQDTAALGRILASEFRRIDGEGMWFTRDDELRRVAADPPGYDSLVFTVERLDVWENGTALVAGTGRVYRSTGDTLRITAYQSTNVLVRRDGRWQAVASHTSGARPEAPTVTGASQAIDHHVHLLGPDLIRDWKAIGIPFSRPDSAYLVPDPILGAPGSRPTGIIDRAVLVSMAHAYGSSELRDALQLSVAQEEQRTRRENDHVAHQATRHPGRALAFCSVAALRPYAMQELMRCSRLPGVGGVKLHLASSEVDLRQRAHLDSLARVARWVAAARLPLLLHLDTQRRGTDTNHIREFARVVLEPNPDLIVIVAHLGGSGGYGRWTRSVFRNLGDWLRDREGVGDPRTTLFFDLSAVILDQPSEGVPATTDDEAALLRDDLRAVGLDRLVFGSDAPSFAPSQVRQGLIERAGLSAAQIQSIIERRVPGLDFR